MGSKRIAFHTLGCKLNFSETSTISRSFNGEGFQQVGFSEPADIYVINSCSVTKNAEKRCKSLIRQVLRKNPDAFVAVIGCFSQINPEELGNIPGVRLVLGNAEKFRLYDHLKLISNGKDGNDHFFSPFDGTEGASDAVNVTGLKGFSSGDSLDTFIPSWSKDDRTRSFFKIQDGCDYFCSYCTIPLARGRSRSNTIAGTLSTAKEISMTGVREIVLSGVNIGDFGKMHNERFVDLLKELVKIDGINRIRISSVEPDLLNDEIIELVAAEPKLMPHFHIPLQAGSDPVLLAMGRQYNTGIFAKRVKSIRKLMPDACIAVDMIAGFPAETRDLFEDSICFISDMDVSYIHVFTYSERDHTRAANIHLRVSSEERAQRSKRLHLLSEEKKKEFYGKSLGKRAVVLWENDHDGGFMYGFTENYIRAKTRFDGKLVNHLQEVLLHTIDNNGIYEINQTN